MSATARSTTAPAMLQFRAVRRQTEKLCEALTPEDMMVQSCAEASPAKWHLAHTAWFFETFVLGEFLPGYRPFHSDFVWLFNSYYNGVSDQPEKRLRASFSRPSLAAIFEYRRHVESAMEELADLGLSEEAERRIVLGVHHEQQHQELLATDIKHAFWTNPLHPTYLAGPVHIAPYGMDQEWASYPGGIGRIGYDGNGFSFDNERPRHPVFLEPFQLASRPVTCAEYLRFIEDRAYERSELWLSDGWTAIQTERWRAPLYWHRGQDGEWVVFTLRGPIPLSELLHTPVCHVSYFEADAYARWAGARLPTEAEWESAAAASLDSPPAGARWENPAQANLLDSGNLHPMPCTPTAENGPRQLLGDVWEWTASAYLGYPGFQPLAGALGEYNGKFMCNQMVLRGGSAVTPASHLRVTYRNFFPPGTRWQFSGIRLARGL